MLVCRQFLKSINQSKLTTLECESEASKIIMVEACGYRLKTTEDSDVDIIRYASLVYIVNDPIFSQFHKVKIATSHLRQFMMMLSQKLFTSV